MEEPSRKTIILFKSIANEEDSYTETLTANNYDVISIKTLDFVYKNLDVLKEKLDKPSNYTGIIFTSPRCVYSVELATNKHGLDERWSKKENYVIGPKTFDLARNILKLECLGKDSGNAKNLADIVMENLSQHSSFRFLYPCGNLASDTLSTIVGSDNLDSVLVYDTMESKTISEDLQKSTDNFRIPIDYVVFFSPSGVRAVNNFKEKLKLSELKIIPIGPTTASALMELNFNCYGTPLKPNVESLLTVLNK